MCKVNKVKCHNQLLSNKHLLPKVTTFNKCKVNKVKCQLQISEALKSVALLPTECAQSVGDKATLRRAPRSHPYKGLNRCARKAAPTQPMLEYARICQMQHILACVWKLWCLNCQSTQVFTHNRLECSLLFSAWLKSSYRCPVEEMLILNLSQQ